MPDWYVKKTQNWKINAVLLFTGICYYLIGFQINRTSFPSVIICYSILFVFYILLFVHKKSFEDSQVFKLGFIFRCVFLFSLPELSDDYFRFLWDGQLTANNINPYDYKPAEVFSVWGVANSYLFEHLNSKEYYSIYPPVNQAIYVLSVKLGLGNLTVSTAIMRLFMIIAEIGTLKLIKLISSEKVKSRAFFLYALNPLVIIEFTGNLHFEGFMVFFIVLAIYGSLKNKTLYIIIGLTLAISTKLLPVILIPLFWRNMNLKTIIIVTVSILTLVILTFLPFYNGTMINHIYSSIQLYFGVFEFNSFVYKINNVLPEWTRKYYTQLLKLCFLGIYGYLFFIKKIFRKISLNEGILLVLTIYFMLSSSVHPWYIGSILVFGLLSRYYKYLMVWLFLLPWTYITYKQSPYDQYWSISIVTYIIVIGILIVEFKKPIILTTFFEGIKKAAFRIIN